MARRFDGEAEDGKECMVGDEEEDDGARVVEASVEASVEVMLFDYQARTWSKKDMRRMQKFMDGCYRLVWSRRSEAPLRQMQREHKMEDMRSELGVKSVRWKIEKRVLERIYQLLWGIVILLCSPSPMIGISGPLEILPRSKKHLKGLWKAF